VVNSIIESNQWMVALKSEFVSPITGVRETPLRQLIKRYPELTKKVFNRCLSSNVFTGAQERERERERERFNKQTPQFLP
jgi:hypothetical protein